MILVEVLTAWHQDLQTHLKRVKLTNTNLSFQPLSMIETFSEVERKVPQKRKDMESKKRQIRSLYESHPLRVHFATRSAKNGFQIQAIPIRAKSGQFYNIFSFSGLGIFPSSPNNKTRRRKKCFSTQKRTSTKAEGKKRKIRRE